MKRISILVLTLSLLALACGSDDVTVSTEAEEPTEPAVVPTDVPADEAPVVEGPLGGGPYPIGTLTFVVSNSQTGDQTAMYTLSCLGDTATLTGDWAPTHGGGLGAVEGDMCLRLADAAVQSRLINGAPGEICTEIYGSPDVAMVTGELDGQPVSATFDRTNGCGIDDWDNVMAGLLPDPTNI